MIDIKKYLEKAKNKSISDNELSQVAALLENNNAFVDKYTLIHIIGLSGNIKYEKTINKYLESTKDPMLARITLQALCSFWDKTDKYLEKVKEFIKGVKWDIDEDVRLIAMSIAGEYLRGKKNNHLITILLNILKDKREMQLIRETAYIALARASGKSWSELPSSAKHFDLEKEIDSHVMEWAISYVENVEANGK